MVYFLFIFCEGTQIERSSFAFAPKIHVNNKLIFIDDIEGRELICPFEDFQAACSIYIYQSTLFFFIYIQNSWLSNCITCITKSSYP